ncbi:hypothetical protein A3C96_01325 [Candidatus Uhrbacteria bacterium RIFCSPHIGHO2_02_FULL_60_10]|uniref:POTRA domain-containing protein n=1 Tax=Candidatus Uhrbacteria bacterium RIFCSPHIGHO2_02_FULL_60_10 TaxID=1802392 RepID=A0A1F7U420_9BACT|nr:MAG: hypothetical protein A3C96_01325 [Candidatus Uhrbacteria bacterium RIFCSPHIGHO2_02_FULL_60_10]
MGWHLGKNQRRAPRDYFRKAYGNPLFGRGHDHRAQGGRFWRWTAVAVVLAALVGGAYYFIWSQSFRIREVSVTGARPATETSLREIIASYQAGRSAFVFPRDNIFFFSPEKLRTEIKLSFFFEDLIIRKKLPGTVLLEVKEKPVQAVLIDGNRFIGLDGNGFIVRDMSEKEIRSLIDLPPDLAAVSVPALGAESMDVPAVAAEAAALKRNRNPWPLLVDLGKRPSGQPAKRQPGQAALTAATVSLVLTAYSRLPDIAGPVRWIMVDEPGESLQAVIAGDWQVYLTTAIPFDVQGNRLGLVLKEKVGDKRANLLYVDLRYNERIFFKFKEVESSSGAAGGSN